MELIKKIIWEDIEALEITGKILKLSKPEKTNLKKIINWGIEKTKEELGEEDIKKSVINNIFLLCLTFLELTRESKIQKTKEEHRKKCHDVFRSGIKRPGKPQDLRPLKAAQEKAIRSLEKCISIVNIEDLINFGQQIEIYKDEDKFFSNNQIKRLARERRKLIPDFRTKTKKIIWFGDKKTLKNVKKTEELIKKYLDKKTKKIEEAQIRIWETMEILKKFGAAFR